MSKILILICFIGFICLTNAQRRPNGGNSTGQPDLNCAFTFTSGSSSASDRVSSRSSPVTIVDSTSLFFNWNSTIDRVQYSGSNCQGGVFQIWPQESFRGGSTRFTLSSNNGHLNLNQRVINSYTFALPNVTSCSIQIRSSTVNGTWSYASSNLTANATTSATVRSMQRAFGFSSLNDVLYSGTACNGTALSLFNNENLRGRYRRWNFTQNVGRIDLNDRTVNSYTVALPEASS